MCGGNVEKDNVSREGNKNYTGEGGANILQREIYVCNVSCAFGHFQQVLATGDNVAVTVICGKTFFNQILS